MAPFVPYHTSAGQLTIINFGGLLTAEVLEPPAERYFLFRQTYKHDLTGRIPPNLRELLDSPNRPKGPLLHLHQSQTEYFRVEAGLMGIEVDGARKPVTSDDGKTSVKAGSIHDSPGDMTVYLSASDAGMDYELDRIFFENWYGYWHDALLHDGGLSLLQYLAIQDGGDAYTPAPAWVTFRRTDYAVAKMKGSFFQRHLVEESFTVAKAWPEQVRLSDGGKPTNAEFEQWTRQLEGEGNEAVKLNGTVNRIGKGNATAKVNGFTDEFDDEDTAQGIRFRK